MRETEVESMGEVLGKVSNRAGGVEDAGTPRGGESPSTMPGSER
jgi:hypothetical protein